MFLSVEDTGEGECVCADVRMFISGHCTYHPGFCIRYVGGESPHQEGPGGCLPLYETKDHGEATTEIRRWDLGLTPGGGGQ